MNTTPPPSLPPAQPENNGHSRNWKSILEEKLVWLVLTSLAAGAVGAMGVWSFFRNEVKTAVDDEVRKRVSESINTSAIPAGAFVLFASACPEKEWEDVSRTFSGRYIYIDQNVTNGVTTLNADGSHLHDGGAHPHMSVTGTGTITGGHERAGSKDSHAAHKDDKVQFTGSAAADGSGHTHNGGTHDHNLVAFRLCKKK